MSFDNPSTGLGSGGSDSAINSDWRLQIGLGGDGLARDLIECLEAVGLKHDLSTSFHNRVVVWRDGRMVFCYAGTRDQAEHAEQLIRSLAGEHGWRVDTELTRWHPVAEDWENADPPLARDDAEQACERAVLRQRDRAGTEELGSAEFEVRVVCPSRRAAVEFAQRLRDAGLPNVRRSRYLLLGALDEDGADALATRLSAMAPAGSSARLIARIPPNPFAILGGLGR